MKRFLWILLVSFFVFSCKEDESPKSPYNSGDQLLINPDFEANNIQVTGWGFLRTGGGYTGNLNSEEFNSPSRSVAILNETIDENHFAYWSQSYTAGTPAGKDLELSAFIKGRALEGEGVAIAIATYDNENSLDAVQFASTQMDGMINGTFDWTRYSVELENIRPETRRIAVFLIMGANTKGEAYFDDVLLKVK